MRNAINLQNGYIKCHKQKMPCSTRSTERAKQGTKFIAYTLFHLNLTRCFLFLLLNLRKGYSQHSIVDVGCNLCLVDIIRKDKRLFEL